MRWGEGPGIAVNPWSWTTVGQKVGGRAGASQCTARQVLSRTEAGLRIKSTESTWCWKHLVYFNGANVALKILANTCVSLVQKITRMTLPKARGGRAQIFMCRTETNCCSCPVGTVEFELTWLGEGKTMKNLNLIKSHGLWWPGTIEVGGNTCIGEVRKFSSSAFRGAICFNSLRSKGAQNGTSYQEPSAILLSCLSSSEKLQYTCLSEWVIPLLLQSKDKN